MTKYNRLSIVIKVFTVLFCILAVVGSVSGTDTDSDITAPLVTSNLTSGTYNTTQNVELTADDPTRIIYYTTNATNPDNTSTQYTGPIEITTTTTLRYTAVDSSGNWSPIYLQNYVIGNGTTTYTNSQINTTGPQTNNTNWIYTITDGFEIEAYAIGPDGTIYVGTFDGYTKNGNLYAIYSNGTLKWSYHTGGVSAITIDPDGTIYVKEYFGTEYAFNPNGTLKWNTKEVTVDTGFRTIGNDGIIYVVVNGLLYAYNPDKTLKWQFGTETAYGLKLNTLSGTPVIGPDGTIYITGRYNVVYLDEAIGVIIATQLCKLYAINPDGTLKWTYDTGFKGTDPVIGPDGTVYLGINRHAFEHPDGTKLYALNPDGTLKWTYKIEDPSLVAKISAINIAKDGTLHFGTYGADWTFYALNSNGTLKWKYTTINYGYINSPGIIGADGTIYFGSDVPTNTDSHLYAFNPDGTIKWKYAVLGGAGNPIIGADGTLYFGSKNKFYSIKDDTTAPIVTAKPGQGSYYAPQNVVLAASETSEIYYTLNGTDPTKNSTKYTGPINIATSKTLKFTAWDNAGNQSPIYIQLYRIYKLVPYSYIAKVPYKKIWYKGKYKVKYKVKKKVRYKVGKRWKYRYNYVTKYKWKRGWLYYWLYKNVTKWNNRWVLA